MMLPDKLTYIERAVKIAGEEILEEISLSEEGSDPLNALSVIKKIINDLLDCTENPELFAEEEFDTHKKSVDLSHQLPARTGHPFSFEMGETVKITNCFKRYSHFSDFLEAIKFPVFLNSERPEDGTKGIVIGRAPHPSWERDFVHHTNLYLIETSEGFYIYGESGLGKV